MPQSYSHLLIARGYSAQDDYGWIVRPATVSKAIEQTLMQVFKLAYRYSNRYTFSPELTPLFIFTVKGITFVIEFTKTDFEDYQSRPIFALQGICLPQAKPSFVAKVVQSNRDLLDTIRALDIDLHTDLVPAQSPLLSLEITANDTSTSQRTSENNLSLPYSEEGYSQFIEQVASSNLQTDMLLFGAPSELLDVFPDKRHIIASINPKAKTKPAPRRTAPQAMDRFNPLYQETEPEKTPEEFNLLAFLKSLLQNKP